MKSTDRWLSNKTVMMLALIGIAMLAEPRFYLLGQDERRSPEIEITRAVFGTGRGRGVCTEEVRRIIQDPTAETEISTPGLGLRNPSGRFRDMLYIWYRVDGVESRLTVANGETINIHAAILEHAAGVAAADDSGSAADGTAEMEATEESPEEDPNSIQRVEFRDREKPIENNLATVVGLFIDEHDDGQQYGVAVDIIAQARGERGPPVDFQRPQGIGREMRISMEEAERAIRARYPKWENGIIRLSFSDKYSDKDGGSSGAAFALLILSLLEGFEIDSNAAITGDILANWKVVGVGAVPEKIHCAVLDQKSIAVIPEDNAENVNDVIVDHSLEHIWEVQVFSVSDLQGLTALTRSDRDAEISEAMTEFATLQQQLRDLGEEVLADPATKERLERILELAPNHESAKCLLAACDGVLPTRLTRSDSLRRLTNQLVSVRDALWNEPDVNRIAVTTVRIEAMEKEVERLEEICHEDLEPVFRQFNRYLGALKQLLASPTRRRVTLFDRVRQELVEELTRISVNREFIENAMRD